MHFAIRELREFRSSWIAIVVFCLSVFFLATGHPSTVPSFNSLTTRLFYWFVVAGVYVGILDYYTLFMYRMWNRLFGTPLPMIVCAGIGVTVITHLGTYIMILIFEPEPVSVFEVLNWRVNLRTILYVHVMETVLLLWGFPIMRARKAMAEQKAYGARGETITLAGNTYPVDRILRVTSQEHYLNVLNEAGECVLRERMKTFLAGVTERDGIQPHRSHWVARRVIASATTGALTLENGEVIPIARGRQAAVRDWLAEHRPDL